jgi:hypothetical protein
MSDEPDAGPPAFDPPEGVVLSGASGRGPKDAEVLVDGVRAGRLPAEWIDVCAGDRRVEVQLAARTLWSEGVSIAEGEETRLAVEARPNAVLVGAEAWPEELRAIASTLTTLAKLPVPADADLCSPPGWDRVALPTGTDLAVAVLPSLARGGDDRLCLYSPILERVYRIVGSIPDPGRPTWQRTAIGVRLTDSAIGGSARVVDVIPASDRHALVMKSTVPAGTGR